MREQQNVQIGDVIQDRLGSIDFEDSQKRAILNSIKQDVTIIHGPPGTGKTTVLCEIIFAFIETFPQHQILVTAGTHNAIDNVLLMFVKRFECKLGNNLLSYCKRLYPKNQHNLSKELELFGFTEENIDAHGTYKEILQNATVLFCTPVHSLKKAYQECISPSFVLVDEASQMTEVDLICTMVGRSTIKGIVLVGDPKQNSPIVLSQAAQQMGMKISLMQRLSDNITSQVTATAAIEKNYLEFLSQQRRMLPEIALLSQKYIYSTVGLPYINSEKVPQNQIHIIPFSEHPIYWLHLNSLDAINKTNHSAHNTASAYYAIKTAVRFIAQGIKGKDVTIITAYKADKYEILMERSSQKKELEQLKQNSQVTCKVDPQELEDIDIQVIDSFQGRESAIIILCTVRSQRLITTETQLACEKEKSKIGFVMNSQRINVAITRASKGLIIIGNIFTFWKSLEKVWMDIIAHLVSNNHVGIDIASFCSKS